MLIQQIITRYAIDNFPKLLEKNECEIEKKLEMAPVKLFQWFHENGMKANQDKYHFHSSLEITTKLSLPDCSIENSSPEKLLGVIIDRKLNFNEHVTNSYNKASKKTQPLGKIFPYIPVTQRKLLMNAYFFSQFEYYPLVWMKYNRISAYSIIRNVQIQK